MRDLYLAFEAIFLAQDNIHSACGHSIQVFDHHFFHMASIAVPGKEKLFMHEEKETILATCTGFGKYIVAIGGTRARHLASAFETLLAPDEVWENNPKAKSAKWVYIKEFSSLPYPFSICLVTERAERKLVVPVSSFPCKRSDIKKWRQGITIFSSRHTKAAHGK
jgi:phage-Barnase-EndoU-ColicinE5/D-RelE like nuclease2